MPIQYERNLYLASGVTMTREVGGNFDKSEAVAGRERRQHDHRAAHAGLLGGQQRQRHARGGARERPRGQGARGRRAQDLRHGSRPARGPDGRGARRRRSRRPRTSRSKRSRPRTSSSSASIRSSTSTASPTRRSTACRTSRPTTTRTTRSIGSAAPESSTRRPIRQKLSAGRRCDGGEEGRAGARRCRSTRRAATLTRAQNLPWFRDYLHPALEEFFEPNLEHHGSYFIGWTNTQEVRWKQQLPHLDGRAARVRREGRDDHDGRRRRRSSTRCTASASSANSNCTRKRAFTRSR